MKRRFDSISNEDIDMSLAPSLKRRRIDPLSLIVEKLEKQDKKMNEIIQKVKDLDNKIKNIDSRLKKVEDFIEENTQPKLPECRSPPSYIY